ncbi:MAG: TlpA family protein disulfide reductase [Magnetococcus sp. WYHC-3]
MWLIPSLILVLWRAGEGVAAPPEWDEIPLTSSAGTVQRLADYRGRVVLVTFWSRGCVPCRDEWPVLAAARERWGSRGLVVLALNYERQIAPTELRHYAQRHHIQFPVLTAPPEDLARLARGMGFIQFLPTSKILDRRGRVVHSLAGALTESRLETLLAALW